MRSRNIRQCKPLDIHTKARAKVLVVGGKGGGGLGGWEQRRGWCGWDGGQEGCVWVVGSTGGVGMGGR